MHSADGQHIGRAKARLKCRGCGYSLRGLPGVHVRCPECGRTNHVLHALSRRRSDWSSNRLYQTLSRSAVGGVAMVLAWCIAAAVEWPTMLLPAVLASAGAVTVLWGVLLRRVAGAFSSPSALGLAAVMHGVLAGYVLAALAVLAMVFFVLPISILTGRVAGVGVLGMLSIVAGVLGVTAGLVLLGWLSYLIDRWVGAACLRQSIESGAADQRASEHDDERQAEQDRTSSTRPRQSAVL